MIANVMTVTPNTTGIAIRTRRIDVGEHQRSQKRGVLWFSRSTPSAVTCQMSSQHAVPKSELHEHRLEREHHPGLERDRVAGSERR